MIGVDLKAPVHGDPIAAAIRSQAEADRVIEHVDLDIAGPHALHVATMRVADEHGEVGLAAFLGRLQKHLGRLQRRSKSAPQQRATLIT